MAKTAKLKQKQNISVHSRAARRATSPTLEGNLDKSLTDLKPPKPSKNSSIAAATAANPYAGISKKTKKKPLTRQQRLRREKGLERADAVLDKLEVKVQKSRGKSKVVVERAKGWEEINGVMVKVPLKKNEDDEDALELARRKVWGEDEDMAVEGEGIPAATGVVEEVQIEGMTAPLLTDLEEEDEIL